MMNTSAPSDPRAGAARLVVGRYALFDEIASGGMATVHLGRMLGAVGFTKTVAIKRLHPHLARNPDFVTMLVDEARLAARVQHPNVVATLDVVTSEGEVLLVLDYVHGESLWHLLAASRAHNARVPPRIVSTVLVNTLHGLHAAHEACDEHGRPLGIVHRDVSPQNVMVGVDGVARVLDFGVAKATGRLQSTHDGQLKGKLAYMAPEQVRGEHVDCKTDLYSASAVLWGALVGRRLVHGKNEGEVLARVLSGGFSPPSAFVQDLPHELDGVVMRGLAFNAHERFQSAREMAQALERACPPASAFEVAEWVRSVAADALALRTARVREMESTSDVRVSMHDASGATILLGSTVRMESGVTGPHYVAGVLPGAAPDAFGATIVRPMTAPSPGAAPGAGVFAPPLAGSSSLPQPPSQGSNAGLIIAAIVSVLVATAAVVFIYLRVVAPSRAPKSATSSAAPSTATTPTTAADPLTDPASMPPPTPTPVESLPVAPPVPTAADPVTPKLASASPSPVPAPTDTPLPPASSARPSRPHKPTKPASCDNPFFVDGDGIKHVKPECM